MEGWTPRNEALLEAVARITKNPWLATCAANMSPLDFERSLWFQKTRCMWWPQRKLLRAGQQVQNGEWVQKVYDYVIACNSLKRNILQMKVVEDFESRPHKAVSFVVEREKEMQEWSEQKLPKVLPGYSGGRFPARSAEERGREEEEPDDGKKERKIRNEVTQEVGVRKKMPSQLHKEPSGKRLSNIGTARKSNTRKRRKRKTGKRRTRWLYNGMRSKSWRRPWNEQGWKGNSLQLDVMQKVPELVVHERMTKGKEVRGTKGKKKVKGWSVEEKKDKVNSLVEIDRNIKMESLE